MYIGTFMLGMSRLHMQAYLDISLFKLALFGAMLANEVSGTGHQSSLPKLYYEADKGGQAAL